MNLYMLGWLGRSGYDCFSGHVVAAPDEQTARALCPCGDECGCHKDSPYREAYFSSLDEGEAMPACGWLDPAKASCDLVGTAAEGVGQGHLMGDFHAG